MKTEEIVVKVKVNVSVEDENTTKDLMKDFAERFVIAAIGMVEPDAVEFAARDMVDEGLTDTEFDVEDCSLAQD